MTRQSRERAVVRAKYPKAFGWRQFSVSDYTVESGDGTTLASAFYAKDAWAIAAMNVTRLTARRKKGKR